MLNNPIRNEITHCVLCKSTILWDQTGNPCMLRSGTALVFKCLKEGCNLITQEVPNHCSTPAELGSFLLTLVYGGIPADAAEWAALKLIQGRTAI